MPPLQPRFLFEGRERMCSPMLKEFVDLFPDEVSPPPVVFTAVEVARTLEYSGHVGMLAKELRRTVMYRAMVRHGVWV